jgi:RND family efflux transporter MFP subunit
MTQKIRIIVQIVMVVVIIFAGLAGFYVLKSGRQSLERQQVQPSLPIVRTVPVVFGDLDMVISGEGTVFPLAEVQIVPQVSGKVIRISEKLVNGGAFKKGDLLLKIEPDDYEIVVTQARAGLREAESTYQNISQESRAAIREWKSLNPDIPAPALVAKEPQVKAALAQVKAQEANLEKALLNLERTNIYAPFDCRVSAEQVDAGQYVSPGQALATVYSTEAAEIVVPMESRSLRWIDVPGFTTDQKQGSDVNVEVDTGGSIQTSQGRVVRAHGKINENTRMINLVVRVDDPFGKIPPLAVGQFTQIKIFGHKVNDAALIPRAALREQNTVWAVDPKEGLLYIRKAKVAHFDSRGVIVTGGVNAGEHVVVSVLKTVTDGMKVQYVASSDKDLQ